MSTSPGGPQVTWSARELVHAVHCVVRHVDRIVGADRHAGHATVREEPLERRRREVEARDHRTRLAGREVDRRHLLDSGLHHEQPIAVDGETLGTGEPLGEHGGDAVPVDRPYVPGRPVGHEQRRTVRRQPGGEGDVGDQDIGNVVDVDDVAAAGLCGHQPVAVADRIGREHECADVLQDVARRRVDHLHAPRERVRQDEVVAVGRHGRSTGKALTRGGESVVERRRPVVEIVRVEAAHREELGDPDRAVSPDGTIWVAEFFAMRGFDPDDLDNCSAPFYDGFSAPGEGFAGAATVSADGNDLILSNTFSGTVQVIDPATGDILQDVRTLVLPTNAIRHGNRLVAAQAGGGNVVDVDDVADVLIADIALPTGLASDGTTLFVADWATGNVWAVDGDGVPTVLAEGLAGPEGLAVDGDRLLVVETGIQQVTAIDFATGETSPVITGLDFSTPPLEGFLPNGGVSGVTVGPDDAIYVSDDAVNSVYQFLR